MLEKKLYYWNPYGTPLDSDHPLEAALKSRPGWTLYSIRAELQTDDYQCGVWSHAALELFVKYFIQGSFDGFASAFYQPPLKPLDDISGNRSAMRNAAAANASYIADVRDDMRQALRYADAEAVMAFRPKPGDFQKATDGERKALQRAGKSTDYGITLE